MSFLPMGSVPKALGFLLAGLARSFDSSCYSHLIANYRSTPGRLGIVSTGSRRRQPAEIPSRRRMVGHRDDRYVEILAKLSDTIVFSAARPGPPERHAHDHVNEQPKPYWLSKFRVFGFEYDEIMSDQLRKKWQAGGTVVWWYHENVMILRRLRSALDR